MVGRPRIEGHLRVDVQVDGGSVRDAWACCTMWRGIERILPERPPWRAPLLRSNRPSLQGQKKLPSSGRGITANERWVHFWLNATKSFAREPHQQTWLVLVGIGEREASVQRHFVERGNTQNRRSDAAAPVPVLGGNHSCLAVNAARVSTMNLRKSRHSTDGPIRRIPTMPDSRSALPPLYWKCL
jgi:hypothetical protein